MRVKAVISYDGSAYEGFQRQKRTPKTVTGALEKALRSLQIDSPVTGSGRTDTGVHASGQVIHFDLPPFWNDLDKLKVMLNRKLLEIRFKHITAVHPSFHARFDAKKRIYRYVFKTVPPSVFEQKYISYYPPFNTAHLQEALKYFVGKHDFSLFHKSGSDIHTSIREICHTAYIQRGQYHYIYFQANGFLRSQVRMMVDAAMQCAREEMPLTALLEQLGCVKKHSTKLAPPQGLYLARILY